MTYAFVFLLFILLAGARYCHTLRVEKLSLEETLKERTTHIFHKNRQLEQTEQQTQMLKKQLIRVKETGEANSRFFADITHEFRTPLSKISGTLERMLDSKNHTRWEEKIRLMARNSRGLLSLADQLMDLARLDSGQLQLKASSQDIIPFLEIIARSFRSAAVGAGLDLEFTPPEEPVTLYYDTEKLEKAIDNLVSNALKFTPPGGKITIAAARKVELGLSAGFLEISVRDTGRGIPNHMLPHIFDRVYRAREPRIQERGANGAGIGLALTKQLLDLHHGRIDVHSAENRGTEFVIRLPMGKEHLKPEEITLTPVPLAQPEPLPQAGDLPAQSMETAFLDEVRRMIDKHLSDPEFNVDHLAGKLYMDRSGLYRKLKTLTGQSPVQYIRSHRLARSAKLLEAHAGNVTEVAMKVGFSNVAYFTKCFKQHFHQLPSHYAEK